MDRSLVFGALLRICLIAAPILASVMSLTSDYNRHPDEIHHFEAARYYVSHFVPPEIGDPTVRDSYSVWGVSYLNYHWIEYFLAGKFILLTRALTGDELLSARLFSVALFFGLSIFFVWRSRTDPDVLLLPALLLVTPQVWYIFSYVNNDAFPLTISFILAYQVAHPESSLSRFLRGDNLHGALVGGLLVGLLLISKTNYYAFLIFAGLWLAYRFPLFRSTEAKPRIDLNRIRRYGAIAIVAVLILTFRCSLDFYVNGETNFVAVSYLNYFTGDFEKQDSRLMKYQEEIAAPPFKPSTIERDLAGTYPGLRLKDKGVGYFEIFFEREWLKASFQSFTGVYGYLNIFASKFYYLAMALIYAVLAAAVVVLLMRRRRRADLVCLVCVVVGAAISVFVSSYLSWSYAFQPQGRYLFPILPMIAVLAYVGRETVSRSFWTALIIACFLLSAFSFVFVGLRRVNTPPPPDAGIYTAKRSAQRPVLDASSNTRLSFSQDAESENLVRIFLASACPARSRSDLFS
jgi:hypothetical protein